MPFRCSSFLHNFVVILFAGLLSACAPQSTDTHSSTEEIPNNGLAWQVQTDGGTVYLVGSMHFGKPDWYPLPSVLDQAFAQSQRLAVEANILEVDPEAVKAVVIKHGLNPPGQNLQGAIGEQLWGQVVQFCQQLGCMEQQFQPLRPWMVSQQLLTLQLQKLAYQQEYGIDRHFLQKAVGKSIPIIELESIAAQLQLFGELTPEQEVTLFEHGLRPIEEVGAELDKLSTAWFEGDADVFRQVVLDPETELGYPALYRRFVKTRNEGMLEKALGFLQQSGSTFMVVGAAHLVGDDGIIKRLKDHGYEPKPLNANNCCVDESRLTALSK